MNEYALLRNGEVVGIVTTSKSPGDVLTLTIRTMYKIDDVKAIDQVPDEVLQRYKFWGERP